MDLRFAKIYKGYFFINPCHPANFSGIGTSRKRKVTKIQLSPLTVTISKGKDRLSNIFSGPIRCFICFRVAKTSILRISQKLGRDVPTEGTFCFSILGCSLTVCGLEGGWLFLVNAVLTEHWFTWTFIVILKTETCSGYAKLSFVSEGGYVGAGVGWPS